MKAEPQSPKRATGWSAIRQQMADLPKPTLIAMVKDLHDASPENRDFLRARFDAENTGGEALEKYRRKIVEQFFPQRGFGKLKLAEARKAIRDYRKTTRNVAGTTVRRARPRDELNRQRSKLGIDATKKLPGEGFKREWPPLIKMDESIRKKINALFSK